MEYVSVYINICMSVFDRQQVEPEVVVTSGSYGFGPNMGVRPFLNHTKSFWMIELKLGLQAEIGMVYNQFEIHSHTRVQSHQSEWTVQNL